VDLKERRKLIQKKTMEEAGRDWDLKKNDSWGKTKAKKK
jgi:hypothetical protein